MSRLAIHTPRIGSRTVPLGHDLVEQGDEFRVFRVRKENMSAVVKGESFGSGEGGGAATGNGGFIEQCETAERHLGVIRAVDVG